MAVLKNGRSTNFGDFKHRVGLAGEGRPLCSLFQVKYMSYHVIYFSFLKISRLSLRAETHPITRQSVGISSSSDFKSVNALKFLSIFILVHYILPPNTLHLLVQKIIMVSSPLPRIYKEPPFYYNRTL